MSNIFNGNKVSYSINVPDSNINDIINGMYHVRMHVDFYQDKFASNPNENRSGNDKDKRTLSALDATNGFGRNGGKPHQAHELKGLNTSNLDTYDKLTTINFYVEPENMPNFSFDANIEDGFKSVLFNTLEQEYKNNKIAKYTKFHTNTYYTPLADNNTRKLYQSGTFQNLTFKFRLYDYRFIQSLSYITTPPMKAFSLLSSCIFPFGKGGSGGSFEEYLNTIITTFTGITKAEDIADVAYEALFGSKLVENMKKLGGIIKNINFRPHGCPTIVIDEIGDNDLSVKNLEFFLTNINTTFSKDLICDESGNFFPTYADFDITLVPTYIPSFETFASWLFNSKTEDGVVNTMDDTANYNKNMFINPKLF